MTKPTPEEIRTLILRSLVTMTGRPNWYWDEMLGEVAPILFSKEDTNWGIFPVPSGISRSMIEMSVNAVRIKCPMVKMLSAV